MASKKYTLALALLGLMQTASFAQTQNDASDSYVFDSSKVSVKNMPQYNEFSKNQYPYPARPRDQWEIGGSIGDAIILGDRPILSGGYTGGIGGSISLRKSISYTFSLRGSYTGSLTTIPGYLDPFVSPPDVNRYQEAKNETHMVSLDLITTLGNIRYHKGNPKTNIYLITGYSLAATRIKHRHPVAGGGSVFTTSYYGPLRTFITTFGSATVNHRKAWGLYHNFDLGTGFTFKLSDKFNLGVEQKIVIPLIGNDHLDGTPLGRTGDIYSLSAVRLNMNLGTKSGTRVQPLWWLNPNNYVYNEVNIPHHMKIPPPILPDADGDGVTDQFDLEPNTPAGAAVDTHGRALDTDGDGVPDYKDKEKLTPQNCFPVNADGVGTCPEPACCKELRELVNKMTINPPPPVCGISSLPSVTFKAGSAKLSKDAQNILMGAAQQLNANPNCHVKVVGYVADQTSKRQQQLSWDRVNAVIKYLVEKEGISEGRIIFSYENTGDANTVDLQPTTDSGPNTVPAPHPQYRTTK